MNSIQTFQGVVRNGRIQIPSLPDLPDGSQVYVLITTGATPLPLLDPHLARRKANGWLISNVGHVMAQHPQLVQVADRLAWQFSAYLTRRAESPAGPVGYVLVDAYQGDVLSTLPDAEDMITNAAAYTASLLSSAS